MTGKSSNKAYYDQKHLFNVRLDKNLAAKLREEHAITVSKFVEYIFDNPELLESIVKDIPYEYRIKRRIPKEQLDIKITLKKED